MTDVTIRVPGGQSLPVFETSVQQEEGVNGFLKALGNNGNENILTIERKRPPIPTKRAKLETYDGAAPPAKADHSIVCTGDCLVAGQSVKVVAYRLT